MFNLNNFVMDTIRGMIGREPDYKVREYALGWYTKAVLVDADLAEINRLIEIKNILAPVPEMPMEPSPDEMPPEEILPDEMPPEEILPDGMPPDETLPGEPPIEPTEPEMQDQQPNL